MKLLILNSGDKKLETQIQKVFRYAEKLLIKKAKIKIFNGVVEVSFISDKDIQKLNKCFRKKDEPTDVLSFSYIEDKKYQAAFDSKNSENILGEIYISVETATKQANERKWLLNKEIEFLFVHGLLHIFGFDHGTDIEEKEMNKIALEITKKCAKIRRPNKFGV